MSLTVQTERLADCLGEMKPLLARHWSEIGRNRERIALNPDYGRYLALDDAGMLHVVTARVGGTLVGYHLSTVANNMHYRDHVYALNDIFYVTPEHRRGRIGMRLLDHAEKTLKERGVSVAFMHVKLAHDFGAMLERRGYVAVERVFEKVLE